MAQWSSGCGHNPWTALFFNSASHCLLSNWPSGVSNCIDDSPIFHHIHFLTCYTFTRIWLWIKSLMLTGCIPILKIILVWLDKFTFMSIMRLICFLFHHQMWLHSLAFTSTDVKDTSFTLFDQYDINRMAILWHYNDVIMRTMASQITIVSVGYSTIYSGTKQRKHQSSASLAFVKGIHRWPVNSPHKWPVTRKMFPFDDAIMVSKATPNKIMHVLFVWFSILTHLSLVLHICVSESGQHWFRQWFVAYSVPYHYLKHFWVIVNCTLRNKIQCNLYRN